MSDEINEKKGLTKKANEWLMKLIDGGQAEQAVSGNPFAYRDGELYLLFDTIRISNSTIIKNSMERGVRCVDICYYWKGAGVYKNVVHHMSLDIDQHHQNLCISGIQGSMKMTIKESIDGMFV